MFGILQRYVMGEVLRAFALALLTVTSIIVLFMVMIEASNMGLSPSEIVHLLPYMVPGSLLYTIPVSLLFAVTVVYGRLASDNEIVAVKTAGLSTMFVLRPAIILGTILSIILLYLSYSPIPIANHKAKMIVLADMEDTFYKVLKKDRQLDRPDWPFLIMVRDVEGRTMLDATFKHRTSSGGRGTPRSFDTIVQAKKARVHFDMTKLQARVYLDDAEVSNPSKDVSLINNTILPFDIPPERRALKLKRIQEQTTPEMIEEQADYLVKMAKERKRWAMSASLGIGMGMLDRVQWEKVQISFSDYGTWKMQWNALETEKHQRIAMSCGTFFFVLLGAPVGIIFARRDFLSAFITCFVPIIILYYPLIILGGNMGKDEILPPVVALWLGNTVLGVLSGLVLPSVMKH
ncbi:LptF/LptG family permease [Singulisphaera acidiphila]|uniref:Putative permease n=1 Tax=Singulisphaera acidiphila (strain ATCC BAA-1392 / DSM 18658 / VKM B-2454 / MOB10) TaxID=886293 RepID=L0DB01_SINAD|nr:LptF/LptG family permease [Singulisphaera acidiphila]AGA26559.1 putative permease [Singulisphaera acidiphila DSM 18658]